MIGEAMRLIALAAKLECELLYAAEETAGD